MKPSYSLDDMRLFWVVAEAGSFRQAATVLGIPPSTLSRRINALEQALGLRLLHRDAHRINLTGTGRQYLERCGPLFSELNDISGELHAENTSQQVCSELQCLSIPCTAGWRTH
jgi:LysR family transcriptional regulator AphB